jgi:hypothetical protein
MQNSTGAIPPSFVKMWLLLKERGQTATLSCCAQKAKQMVRPKICDGTSLQPLMTGQLALAGKLPKIVDFLGTKPCKACVHLAKGVVLEKLHFQSALGHNCTIIEEGQEIYESRPSW